MRKVKIARVNLQDERPLYMQAKESLQTYIARQRFQAHDRLPTELALAKALQLSVGTVQKALNLLRQERRIYRRRKLGTFLADRVQSSKSSMGKIAIFLRSRFSIASQFYHEIMEGIESAARERRCQVLFSTLTPDEDSVDDLVLGEKDLLGAILIGQVQAEVARKLKSRQIPFVVVHGYFPDPCDSVAVDNRRAARKATSYLIGLGHKKIGFLSWDFERMPAFQDRLAGFREAMRERRLKVNEAWIRAGGDQNYGNCGSLLDGLPSPRRDWPTAWFCTADLMATEAVRWFLKKGLRVPEDVSIIGFGDHFVARNSIPALSTVWFSRFDMGKKGIELLLSRVQSRSRRPKRVHLPTRLIIRDTCAKPPATS